MTACRADLGGPPGRRLADHVGQVGPRPAPDPARPGPGRAARPAPARRPPARPGGAPPAPGAVDACRVRGPGSRAASRAGPARSRRAEHPQARHQARLGRVRRAARPRPRTRWPPRPPPRAARPGPGAAGRRAPARRGTAMPSRAAGGMAAAAARMAMAMPRSKPLPRLGRLAGDRPTVIRRCGHFSRLLTMAARIRSRASRSAVSGRPTSMRPTQPVLDVGLDLDRVALHAHQRDGVGARQTALSPPPDVLDGEVPGPVPEQPDHIDPHLVEQHPVRDHPATASRRSRACLPRLTPRAGCRNPVPDRVLTSQATSTRRSAATMSISPSAAAPVAVEDPQPGLLQVLGGSCSPCWPRASLSAIRHHLRRRTLPDPARGRPRQSRAVDRREPTAVETVHGGGRICRPPDASNAAGPGYLSGTSSSALGQFLDVDVLERDNPHVLHEPRRPVHVPDPGVLHDDLEEHLAVVGAVRTFSSTWLVR